MTSTDFTSLDDASDLVASVFAALPTWPSYHAFGGRPHVRALAVDTFTITDPDQALAALRSLPDAIAEDAEMVPDWRTADLVGALRAWGWASDQRGGAVRIGGLWGDAVYPANFAALLAIAPFRGGRSDPWVFGAETDREPVVAVSFLDGGVRVHADVDIAYHLV